MLCVRQRCSSANYDVALRGRHVRAAGSGAGSAQGRKRAQLAVEQLEAGGG
jgi:hypothetical protein